MQIKRASSVVGDRILTSAYATPIEQEAMSELRSVVRCGPRCGERRGRWTHGFTDWPILVRLWLNKVCRQGQSSKRRCRYGICRLDGKVPILLAILVETPAAPLSTPPVPVTHPTPSLVIGCTSPAESPLHRASDVLYRGSHHHERARARSILPALTSIPSL